jgi:hypothetical protein
VVLGPNNLLRAARERTLSRRAPGECMGRSELAEAVCAWLWETTQTRYELDGHYVAKLERGVVRWPSAAYRSGFRHVLNVASDAELGFAPSGHAPGVQVDRSPVESRDSLESMLMNAADESGRFLAFAEGSNVGELTVEQMHADVRRIAHLYLKVPTLPLFTRTCGLRDRAFVLLEGRQRPAQTRELYAAAGWALTMLAWMSVDLGRPDTAEDHARTAWACAVNADHKGLRAWVRATQHTAAFWQADYARAATYAADGLGYATGTARTFLASAHALDLARDRRSEPARVALAEAQDAAESAEPEDEIGGPFTCTRDRAASLWSDTHLALREPDDALRLAADAVAAFEATPEDQRNAGSERMTRVQVVKAYIQQRELDGAAEALAPVLATPPEHRVRPLLQRVAEVGKMVSAPSAATTRVARGITAGVAEFGRHPALAELRP